MKKIFFTPGPSQLYPTVKKHMKKALSEDITSISHRGEKFQKIYAETVSSLRDLLEIPSKHKIFFLSSGTEAMERVIQNCAAEHSYHFVSGAFSKRFFKTAQELGKTAKKAEAKEEGFDFAKINIPKQTELICITQNETSTGVYIPAEFIYKLRKRNADKLIAVDTVSSAPYVDLDYQKLDAVFFSVQKGFGLPGGLAILIISPKAFQKANTIISKGISTGSYHSFISLDEYAVKNQTPETPNVLAIYLLGKVCQDMIKKKIEKVRKETEAKAKLLYDFFESDGRYSIFVPEVILRSKTVIVIETRVDSQIIINHLKTKGLYVGSGYGEYKSKQLRIANFPAHSVGDIKRLINEVRTLNIQTATSSP